MSTIPTIVITPSAAAGAYAKINQGQVDGASGATAFGATLQRAMADAITTGQNADDQAMQAISGGGNLTEVVTALSHAELTLQTATAIRDRVVQAYQDILKMPI